MASLRSSNCLLLAASLAVQDSGNFMMESSCDCSQSHHESRVRRERRFAKSGSILFGEKLNQTSKSVAHDRVSNIDLQQMKIIGKAFMSLVFASACPGSPACHANAWILGRTVRSWGCRSRPSGRRPWSAPSRGTSPFFNRQFDKARDCFSSIPSIKNLRSLHPERKWAWALAQASESVTMSRHGKNYRCDMLSKSLAMHWGASSQTRNSPAGSCVSIVLQASH